MPFDRAVVAYKFEPSPAARDKPKEVGGGLFRAIVPATVTVTATSDDAEPLEHDVVMHLDVVDERLVCISCEIRMRPGGPSVTADAIRRVPVGRFLREAVVDAGWAIQEVDADGDGHDFWAPPANFATAGMTDSVLRDVARLYHWARATGVAPLGLLQEYRIPRGKASRWIATARRRGLIKDKPDGR